jgi:hypothetical protein
VPPDTPQQPSTGWKVCDRRVVARGAANHGRELPLIWKGRTYFFDFAFPADRTVLETNGRRWHDDPIDFEAHNEKWSVPGRHCFKLVLATWDKVVRRPDDFVEELERTRAA